MPLVETEGQWSRRGDIVDIFPVAAELPLRLEWFGDELERLREFDPATQRSLEKIESLVLTPTHFSFYHCSKRWRKPIEIYRLISMTMREKNSKKMAFLQVYSDYYLWRFPSPASVLDYLPQDTLLAFDELEQCQAHCENWLSYVAEQWEGLQPVDFSLVHRPFEACCQQAQGFSFTLFG